MRTVVAAIVLAVCAGCGQSSSRPPSVPAEAEARAARRGLWGACPVSAPTPVKTLPTAPTQNVAPPGGVYYRSCDDARRAGAAPLHRGDGGYREALDGDGDGVACE